MLHTEPRHRVASSSPSDCRERSSEGTMASRPLETTHEKPGSRRPAHQPSEATAEFDLERFAASWESSEPRVAARRLRSVGDNDPATYSSISNELRPNELKHSESIPSKSTANESMASESIHCGEPTDGEPASPSVVKSWTLRELRRSGLALEVESTLLEDTIWWVADSAQMPGEQSQDRCRDLPVYRAAELELLVGLEARPLRQLHRLKRLFDVRFERVQSEPSSTDGCSDPEAIPLDWLDPGIPGDAGISSLSPASVGAASAPREAVEEECRGA